MSSIFHDRDFALRVEESIRLFGVKLTVAKGDLVEVVPILDGAIYLHKDVPDWSKAIGVGLNREVGDDDIRRMEAIFEERSLEPAISATPWHHPSLFEVTGKRGWAISDWGTLLAACLDELPDIGPVNPSISITIAGQDEMELWAETIGRGYEGDEAISEDDRALHLGLARTAGVHCLLARVDGEIAGASIVSLIPEVGVLSIMSSSTLPDFRRRGIQMAFIRERLQMGRDAGLEIAIVTCHPGSASQRNVERAGFQVVYNRCLLSRAVD
ncbi:GNAT family N-acetyltransferase [bacterium]|nr:GNAT family N-acetyltransferase [bacterium]